ncbi:vacuolar assembly/sorting protein-like protein VPS8 [Tothia fuscella]|uniref:Vacuolar assembly/sorting protein-like protein VPS8 n=1 Tax=Tothia fuscella TaxID=1048955 RepID=A0A9P4P4L3_9PEZI|nr:vacuolar assembly/sorting protein-like protein VPS8 [Tothia fuscella]
MSSSAGEGLASPDAEDYFAGTIERQDGNKESSSEPKSETESFSRTKSPDFLPSGDQSPSLGVNGTSFQGYGKIVREEDEEEDFNSVNSPDLAQLEGSIRVEGVASPDDSASTLETPDDAPSIRESILSSPGSSRAASRLSVPRAHRPGALQPFDRRFSSFLGSSPQATPRNISPAFLHSHSRQSSIASTLLQSQEGSEAETPQPPWEVVRWTKLKKITGSVFSETGKRNYGRATVIAVGASIAIGTSKGLTLVFDYHQNLSATIGLGTKAVESGAVTSLAISADHSTIAAGHSSGHIFTWEIARPAKPFLHIVPLDVSQLEPRTVDGHISGTAIVHVGFLGTRHTALVSADQGGMAFSHLATRGFGVVARAVKTTRVLGRYPPPEKTIERPRKPSSVLAFGPLPLGNIEQSTDALGLTALLTPYLLVIVSTTPIAETQFKNSRPKDVAPHSTLSGCLAWFPAVKLKRPAPGTQSSISKTKLVYCWSNVLTILDITAEGVPEKDKPPTLQFKPRSRWKCEEAIVAVQWLGRSVLGVLTISQRLIIVEDSTLRVTDSFDLLRKHIYHNDLFSQQLNPVIEQLDEQDSSMHGVVADAFHMSFRAYKGRLFLLGFNDVSIGTLSNWADRLVALMEEGDYIAAIRLATSYYSGDADKITVGLPEDNAARHALVQEKLLEMLSASLKYTFTRSKTAVSEDRQTQLKELGEACFTACKSMGEMDFLFEEVYEPYSQDSAEGVFFEVLEPYILEEEITAIPPDVLQDLISHYASQDRASRLEELICRLDTNTMDLHQITTLCKQHRLYDALIYVWNQAIGDYTTPLVELLTLVRMVENDEAGADVQPQTLVASAMKIFPYLAYTFTGRVYPSGLDMDEEGAYRSKAEIYGFLFSGRIINWPPGSNDEFPTVSEDDDEPPYPYLSLLLRFDTPSFMSVLNEAFEDQFLNGPSDTATNGFTTNGGTQTPTLLPTRQTIISILLEVLGSDEFDAEDSVYLDMFIARNLPKFPQFIMLPGNILRKVLEGLCNYPSDELAEDCQLSVEYLLSFYHPPDIASLIPLFRSAGFFGVLKSVYRGSKEYPQLIQTYFEDLNDRESVFDSIGDCLRPGSSLTHKQRKEVETVIVKNASNLASINTVKTAQTLRDFAPDLVESVLDALDDGSQAQFTLLRTIMEPALHDSAAIQTPAETPSGFEERYVKLMCMYDAMHVADYVSLLKSGDLNLNAVLPSMESSGVIDAAVVLLARDSLVREAMDRLVKHMRTLETALTELLSAAADSPDVGNTTETAEDLLEAVQKYSKVGIWLCQRQTKAADHSDTSSKNRKKPNLHDPEADLTLDERLWLDLVDIVVTITKEVSLAAEDIPPNHPLDIRKITSTLRSTVQTAFTALLTSTTRQPIPKSTHLPLSQPPPSKQPHPTFLLILCAFLTRASKSSPSLSDLRAVLSEIFAAYTFEETILHLANQFLGKDLFGHVDEAWRLRQRGWRPRGNVCEGCRRRVWGPGVGGEVWNSWERKRVEEERGRRGRVLERRASEQAGGKVERGKGRALPSYADGVEGGKDYEDTSAGAEGDGIQVQEKEELGPLVVFACRHVWHKKCVEKAMEAASASAVGNSVSREREMLKCPLQHHHGVGGV